MSEAQEGAQEASTAAATEGHIELTGGSSPVSFDEFESLDAAEKQEAKLEARKEKLKEDAKKEATKDKKSESKKQAKDKKESKAEQPEEPGESREEASEQKEAGAEKSEESQEAAKVPQKIRSYKLKSGDNEVTIRSDAKVPVKIDGETTEATVQDLINAYSGHKAVDKRFGELGAEKQKFIEEKKVINDTIGEMAKAITEGTPQKALMRFFEALGADPIKGMQDLKKSFLKGLDIQTLAETPEEERDSVIEASSTQDYKAWYDEQQARKQTEAKNQQLNSRILQLQQQYQVDDVAFNNMAEELFKLKERGTLTSEITPELIVKQVVFDRKIGKAQEILEKINPELKQNQEAVEKVVSLLEARLSDQDVAEFVAKKYGTSEALTQDALSKKFERTTGVNKTPKEKLPQNEDMWSFEQL